MVSLKKTFVDTALSLTLYSLVCPAFANQTLGWKEQGLLLPEHAMVNVGLDTGSEHSSVAADNIVPYEKGEEKWVRFVLQIPTGFTGALTAVTFERKVVYVEKNKGVIGSNHRQVVKMSLCLGTEVYQGEFSLKPLGKQGYNFNLGRVALTRIGAVDASRSNTVKPDCAISTATPSP